MYLDSGIKSECTGCTACKEVCAHHAITMQPDGEGFLYPVINQEACVNCGLCRKVCPVAYPKYEKSADPKTYAAYLKDVEQRKKSASGGMFYAIARLVLAKGGLVVGAAFDKDLNVNHMMVDNIADLSPLRSSKYVQSNLNDIFLEIRKQLLAGRMVYFTGTPCQVAGLNAFLIKDYENLITSDLICHGVPSQKLFREHLAYREKENGAKINGFSFRNDASWSLCETCQFEEPKKKDSKYSYVAISPFLYAFLKAYIYRPSCYDCPFAKIPRQGDITIGDYWGIEQFHPAMNPRHAVSVALVNTEKGAKMWEEISGQIDYEPSDWRNIADSNPNLVQPTKKPAERDAIMAELAEKGYPYMAKTAFRPRSYMKWQIRHRIKRLLGK